MQNSLVTVFGEITVRINDCPVPFGVRVFDFVDWVGTGETGIQVSLIEVDLSDCKIGDVVFVGFEGPVLKFHDSDERVVLFSAEDDTTILGFGAYEPEDDFEPDIYCYEIFGMEPQGATYEIRRDPSLYDKEDFYHSVIIPVGVCEFTREYFEKHLSDRPYEMDEVIDLALFQCVG